MGGIVPRISPLTFDYFWCFRLLTLCRIILPSFSQQVPLPVALFGLGRGCHLKSTFLRQLPCIPCLPHGPCPSGRQREIADFFWELGVIPRCSGALKVGPAKTMQPTRTCKENHGQAKARKYERKPASNVANHTRRKETSQSSQTRRFPAHSKDPFVPEVPFWVPIDNPWVQNTSKHQPANEWG